MLRGRRDGARLAVGHRVAKHPQQKGTYRMRTATPILLCLATLLACSRPAEPPAAPGADAAPAVRIGDQVISVGELDAWIKDQLFEQETRNGDPAKLYEVRAQGADNLIAQRLLEAEAKKLGQSPDSLLETEARKRTSVPDEDVDRFYDEHKASFGDRPAEEVKQQIRDHLERRRAPEAAREYVDSLREGANVVVLLERPRTQVAATGPARGPADAPVTIIEFSDYQCPFCRRAEPTVEQVLKDNEGKIRFVYRHFPLDRIHPQARGASEAAACADKQGKFWEYHDALFADDAKLDREGLDKIADRVGLDAKAFKTCVEKHETKDLVDEDVQAGTAAGVTGTPAFFINGIPLRGALPAADFQRVIDEELAAKAPQAKG
jgi:predicted DsbA family dithiol-disulfide isomerase